jgi:hypothetical protein
MPATVLVILIAAALIVAWYLDVNSWKKKSRDELVGMAQSRNWRFHRVALEELKRRGEDTTVYIPQFVALLVSESKIERASAHLTLQDCFPSIAAEIKGYTGTADLSQCRTKASSLLLRYGIES